jgi:hypothetical protein
MYLLPYENYTPPCVFKPCVATAQAYVRHVHAKKQTSAHIKTVACWVSSSTASRYHINHSSSSCCAGLWCVKCA